MGVNTWVDGLMLKNPTATSIQATNWRSTPITGIMAPMSRSMPPVLNMPSPDFAARMPNALL